MGNHYYLLLQTTGKNLSKSMQWFDTPYTRYYNLNNRTGGLLFQGRFKSIHISQASVIMDFDIEKARLSKRMVSQAKDKRDFIMYLMWEIGGLSNRKIAEAFNLTYSSVSRRVSEMRNRLNENKKLHDQYKLLKSKIKV